MYSVGEDPAEKGIHEMALYLADTFLSLIDQRRFLSITGAKGDGKDLLTQELVEYYLRRKCEVTGKYYKLFTNQKCVWADRIMDDRGDYCDARGTVFWVTEAGMYLRLMEIFRHPYSMARKLGNYFFFPSIELPHAILQAFVAHPVFIWRQLLGLFYSPTWSYDVKDGWNEPFGDTFWFFPRKERIGVYDTQDPSENTTAIFKTYEKTIERIQAEQYKRDGLSTMAFSGDDLDVSAQYKIAEALQGAALSLQKANQRK